MSVVHLPHISDTAKRLSLAGTLYAELINDPSVRRQKRKPGSAFKSCRGQIIFSEIGMGSKALLSRVLGVRWWEFENWFDGKRIERIRRIWADLIRENPSTPSAAGTAALPGSLLAVGQTMF